MNDAFERLMSTRAMVDKLIEPQISESALVGASGSGPRGSYTLQDLADLAARLKPKPRTILCAPHMVDMLRAKLEEEGLDEGITVNPSEHVPIDQVYIFDNPDWDLGDG